MTASEAKDRLRLMVAATSSPELSNDEVDQLMLLARRPDMDGRVDGDDGWEPTWALGAAAAEGWRWKAGRVADRVDFAADGTRLSRSQMVAHCLRMADVYRGRQLTTIVLSASGTAAAAGSEVPEGWAPLMPGDQGPIHAGPPYLSTLALPGARARGDSTA